LCSTIIARARPNNINYRSSSTVNLHRIIALAHKFDSNQYLLYLVALLFVMVNFLSEQELPSHLLFQMILLLKPVQIKAKAVLNLALTNILTNKMDRMLFRYL